jgi:hypothetical protein
MIEALGRRALATLIVAATAMGAVAALGPATAGAETLYNQIESGERAILSQEFASVSDEDTAVADDFTVPAGQTWTIAEAVSVWLAEGSDIANLPGVNLVIYASAGSHPGSPLFARADLPIEPRVLDEGEEIFAYEVPLTGVPVLGPGTYWLSMQVHGSQATYGSWFWGDVAPQRGSAAVLRNPGDGFGTGCTDWTPRVSCLLEGSGEPDQDFILRGTKTVTSPSPPPPAPESTPAPKQPKPKVTIDGAPKTDGNGTASVTVKVSGPGLVSAGGKGVVGLKVHVAKAGKVHLELKLNASGKKALRRSKSGKLKIKVKISFTPKGGRAVTTTKRVTFSAQPRASPALKPRR